MKIFDIAFKDLSQSFRSAFAVGTMVLAPLMLTGLIYFAFGGASNGTSRIPAVKVGVVNLDVLPTAAPLDVPLGDNVRNMFFDESVASWITASNYMAEESVRSALDKQVIGVAVIIPHNFTEHFLSGDKDVQVLIVSDPTLSIGPTVVQNMVTTMLDGVSGGEIALETFLSRQQANGITTDPSQIQSWIERYTTWYVDFQRNLLHHPEKAAFVMVAPSAGETETADPIQKVMGLTLAGQMIFFAFFSGSFSMISILQESEEGTLARLFTTPTARTSILMGKFAAVFITVSIQGLVLMIAGHYIFGINWGDSSGAALALIGQVIAATGLGVMLIAFVKSTRQGGPVLGGGLTVLGMLGGLFTANMPNALPEAMNLIAYLTPQGWVLKSWRIIMEGGSASDLLVPFAMIVGMGVVMFIVGALKFRKRFA